MATSIHIPARLRTRLDRRARQLGISRNRLIVRAVEKELDRQEEWTPGFFEFLEDVDEADVRVVDEMTKAIEVNRSSKKPIGL